MNTWFRGQLRRCANMFGMWRLRTINACICCYVPSLRAHVKTRFPNAAHSASIHQPSPLFSRSTGDDGTQGYPVTSTRSCCAMAVVCAGHCCGRAATVDALQHTRMARSRGRSPHVSKAASVARMGLARSSQCQLLLKRRPTFSSFGWLGVQANRTAREVDSEDVHAVGLSCACMPMHTIPYETYVTVGSALHCTARVAQLKLSALRPFLRQSVACDSTSVGRQRWPSGLDRAGSLVGAARAIRSH
jgi:hypothetical protein